MHVLWHRVGKGFFKKQNFHMISETVILDKVKINVEMISSQILGKRFSEFPTGIEPMTF